MNKLHTDGTKKITSLFLTGFLILLSISAYAGRISTIDGLTSTYSPEVCKECHKETHNGWKNSWHGKSVIDPRVLRTWRTFILRGLDVSEGSRKDLRDICLPCHAPRTRDASDDLVREIAAMIITAVEESDTYETEKKPATVKTDAQTESAETAKEPPPEPAEQVIDTAKIREKEEYRPEKVPVSAEELFSDSPWIRVEIAPEKDMISALYKAAAPYLIQESPEDVSETTTVSVDDRPPQEPETEEETEDEEAAPEPVGDLTVSFVEEGDSPVEPAEDLTMEAEELSATLVVDGGKVRIEYMPYDPELEPSFLDKGETLGEKAVREISKLNIDCMICHSMKALPGGNPKPRTIYGTTGSGSLEHKEALGAETAVSAFIKTSEFCAQCHHGCPPGMPSSICPTLWTSYKEKYIARGGKSTCQDCHMSGDDRKSHRFPGIYDKEQLKKGIELTLEAEPARHVHHLENKIVPAVVINVKVKNTAGHGIPHGCTYIPKAVLRVTVTDQAGNDLFINNKTYEVYNVHLSRNREGYLGLNEWDITAMERLDMGIEPGSTDSQTFVALLKEETSSVIVEASFKYIYEEGVSAVVHKEIKKIEIGNEIEKKSPSM